MNNMNANIKKSNIFMPRRKEPQPMQKQEREMKSEQRFDIFHLNLLFRDPELKNPHIGLVDILIFIVVVLFSLYNHFVEFGEPNTVVFDEVYFGNFTNYYRNGIYFFDIHPPLGKELIYLGSLISGYQGDLVYTSIGQNFTNNNVKRVRFWPSLVGSLITPVIYVALRLNNVNYMWSAVGSLLPALDNAMLVESRFILIDAYLWFFAVLTVMLCSLTIRYPKRGLLLAALAGLAAGATVSVKFTGAGISIGLIIGFLLHFPLVTAIKYCFVAGISGVFVFVSSFYIHFKLLTKQGPGCRFHPPNFCANLAKGSVNAIAETFALIRQMLSSNFAINQAHPYSSKWWQWPLQLGLGNWMWVVGNKELWCVGSPLVWYFGFFGLVLYCALLIFKRNLLRSLWILVCYILSYLPFGLISRVMWNYHYIIPLELSIIIASIACSSFKSRIVSYVIPLIVLSIGVFVYIIQYPITYGSPITREKFDKIMFQRWHY